MIDFLLDLFVVYMGLCCWSGVIVVVIGVVLYAMSELTGKVKK
jgi:hypothetical protein